MEKELIVVDKIRLVTSLAFSVLLSNMNEERREQLVNREFGIDVKNLNEEEHCFLEEQVTIYSEFIDNMKEPNVTWTPTIEAPKDTDITEVDFEDAPTQEPNPEENAVFRVVRNDEGQDVK